MWEVYSELLAWSNSGLRTSMTTIIESEQHRIMTQNLCFLYYLYPTCPFLCLSTTLTILRVFLIVPCLDFEHAHMSLRNFQHRFGNQGGWSANLFDSMFRVYQIFIQFLLVDVSLRLPLILGRRTTTLTGTFESLLSIFNNSNNLSWFI